jgi:hypothetical protein
VSNLEALLLLRPKARVVIMRNIGGRGLSLMYEEEGYSFHCGGQDLSEALGEAEVCASEHIAELTGEEVK